MIEIVEYSGDKLREGAQIARKARLYVSGWCLNSYLKGECQPYAEHNGSKIALAFKDGVPVGIAYTTQWGFLQTFVRKSERRKGIGKAVANKIKTEKSYGYQGLKKGQTRAFFDSVGITFVEQ